MASHLAPPEIWLQIIRDASYVPFDTSEYDPLFIGASHKIQSAKAFALCREALSTKYAISLVCRSWHTIVDEFLYECIIIQEAIHIPLLVGQLSRIGTHISSRVQRLDFLCEAPRRTIHYKGVSYNSKQLARAAAKLICLCPRLRVLSSSATLWEGGGMRGDYHNRFLLKALMEVQDTIECLDWRSPCGSKAMWDLYCLHLPKLRLLICSWDPWRRASSGKNVKRRPEVLTGSTDENREEDRALTDNTDESDEEFYTRLNPRPKPTGPTVLWTYLHLHTLDLHYYGDWVPFHNMIPDYLASLKHIIIGPMANLPLLDQEWHFFSQVNTVTFRRAGFSHFNYSGRRLPSTVHTIVFYIQELPVTQIAFPHVKRIGLMGAESLMPDEFDYAFNLFVGGWRSAEDNFSGLEMIRFMDTSLSSLLRRRESQFRLWERRSWSKGVRLEDDTGRLITADRLQQYNQ